MKITKFGEYKDGGKWVEFEKDYPTMCSRLRLGYFGEIETIWVNETHIIYSQKDLEFTISKTNNEEHKKVMQRALDVMEGRIKEINLTD